MKLLQNKVGTTAYLERYNSVRHDMLEKRQERKTKRALEAVSDPERATQKKIKQHNKVLPFCKKRLIL